MANPCPSTEHLVEHQIQPVGDRSLGRVIGTRYPEEVEAFLRSLPDHQAFIRQAVVEKWLRDRVLWETVPERIERDAALQWILQFGKKLPGRKIALKLLYWCHESEQQWVYERLKDAIEQGKRNARDVRR